MAKAITAVLAKPIVIGNSIGFSASRKREQRVTEREQHLKIN